MAQNPRNGNRAEQRDHDASRAAMDDEAARQQAQTAQADDADIPDDVPGDPRAALSKLTMSTIGVSGKMVTDEFKSARMSMGLPDGELAMAKVWGYLDGFTELKVIPAKDGKPARETVGIVGNMEGLNLLDGTIVSGGVFYAPSGFHELMISRLKAALVAGSRRVAFAMQFSAVPSQNQAGFSWKIYNLLPPSSEDPLRSLRHRALAGKEHPALEAAQERAALTHKPS